MNDLPDFHDYKNLPESERKAIWNAPARRRAAIAKAEKEARPSKSDDEVMLAQVEERIEKLQKQGADISIFEKKRLEIVSRIEADADLASRKGSPDGLATAETFNKYRDFILANGSVDDVVDHDARVERYWKNGGTGESSNPAWATAIQGYAALRVRVETQAEAAAKVAQEAADIAQQDANTLKGAADALKQDTGNSGEGSQVEN